MQSMEERTAADRMALLHRLVRQLQRAEATRTAVTHALLLILVFLIIVIGLNAASSFWPGLASFKRTAGTDLLMALILLAGATTLFIGSSRARATADDEVGMLRAEIEDLQRGLDHRA